MSHIDVGPLARYNSLTDPHLATYFSGQRMKRHLRKSGLVTRGGAVVSETTLRENNARREHKRHVRDLLAQAIVHRTLDAERGRQVHVRRRLEEIAKIELVKRVQTELGRKGDEEILPYLTPRKSKRSRPSSVPAGGSHAEVRPISAPVNKAGYRKRSTSPSPTSERLAYVNNDGREGRGQGDTSRKGRRKGVPSKYPREHIDDRNLYALDQHALREYLAVQRALAASPYQAPQLASDRAPTPPQGRPRSPGAVQRNRRRVQPTTASGARPVKGPPRSNKGSLLLHRAEPAMRHQERVQTLCDVTMHYFGGRLRLDYERFDADDEVVVEQQHCGGNTLIVFREKVKAATDFQFVSRRHRGYPFSLTLYVNGTLAGRVSACCEYKHGAGSRLGGMLGMFGVVGVSGAAPCYRCHIKREMAERKRPAPPRQTKRVASEVGDKVVVRESEQTTSAPVDRDREDDRADGRADGRADDTERTERSSGVNVVGMTDNIETVRETGRSENAVEVAVEKDEEDERPDLVEEENYDYSDDDFEPEDNKTDVKEENKMEIEMKTDQGSDKENKENDKEIDKESEKDTTVIYSDNGYNFDKLTAEEWIVPVRPAEKTDRKFPSLSVDLEARIGRVAPPSKVDELAAEIAPIADEASESRARRREVIGPEEEEEEEEEVAAGGRAGEEPGGDERLADEPAARSRSRVARVKSARARRLPGTPRGGATGGAGGEAAKGAPRTNGADSDSDSSSDSSRSRSSSSSSSESDSDSGNDLTLKAKLSESDGENVAGGHDPDNVAIGRVDPVLRPTTPATRHDGSIGSLIKGQQEVVLTGISLTKDQVGELAAELTESRACRSLQLSNCDLDAASLDVVAAALTAAPHGGEKLRTLNVNSNRLGPDAVPALLQITAAVPQLDHLLLSDNPLTDAGCVCLLDGLLASHRRDVERRHLAAIADTADSVVATVMADVIGDGAADDERDADAVAVVGGEGNSTATGGAEQRAGGLRLEELGLADVGMATGGVAALARLLRAGARVSSLALGGNRAVSDGGGDDGGGWTPLTDALAADVGGIATLSLERNALGDGGATAVAAAIAANTTLRCVDLERNEIGDGGARRLLDAMRVNSTLGDVTLAPGNAGVGADTAATIKRLAAINNAG